MWSLLWLHDVMIVVGRVNMTSHPGMMEVPWYYVRVEPGDCLYLPYNWIHHVRA